ncbi:CidA/LrgA family protein [Orbus sturtevantii]|uniref:CidA/LrgA family protein n=1 Tax=Orbus sturtevantii TaxID=3074109 RepID=UPI00370D25E6
MKHFLARHATMRHRLYSLYYTTFNYGRSFLILFICLSVGNVVSKLLPITIPGSIIGLLILFFLLVFQLIPSKWIRNGCNLFMRYMTILFIPAAMGIMDNYIYLLDGWVPILIGSTISTFIVMLFIGWLTQHLQPAISPSLETNEEQK